MRPVALLALLAACSAPQRRPAPVVPVAPVAPVATVAPAPPPPLAVAAVDDAVRATWVTAGVEPAPPAADGEYLRRVTLDLVGRVPTRAEVAAYHGDKAALVERLLASPDYAEHWADVYEDLLVGRRVRLKPGGAASVHTFLRDAFAAGMPYDQLATRLLAAEGAVAEHGEVGFLAAHVLPGQGPELVAGVAARVFLGVQIQCAQCHDHPYDERYKKADFWGFASYFGRAKVRPFDIDGQKTLVLFEAPRNAVKDPPRFLGRTIAGDGRRALAEAIVHSDLFAKAVVNRTWAACFGRGIVQPWDDLGGEHDPGHPPLLDLLAADFAGHGHDLRRLLATIVLSEAYGRAAAGGGDGAEARFARAAVRPLAPEPLFRSLLVATALPASAAQKVGAEEVERRLDQGLKQFIFVFGDDEMGEADRATATIQQALLLFNGEGTNQGVRARPGSELRAILDATRDPSARLEALYAAAFARAPSAAERARLLPALRGAGAAAYEDLFFALVTSTEFTTNH